MTAEGEQRHWRSRCSGSFVRSYSAAIWMRAAVSSCLYGRLPMARPIWHVWRAGCSFISGLLVQGFVLLALMESADPHLICRPSSTLRTRFRFGGSRSDLFAITPLYGRLPMARPIWHVWRAGCSFISGLLVQGFVLLALMESADPHLICRPSSTLRTRFRFGGSRSDLFAITPLYGRLPMARPIWHVWRAGCSFISGLLVQGFVLLALMESADPHLICRPSSTLRTRFRFGGSRSDLFAITPCRTLRNLSEATSCAGSFLPSSSAVTPARNLSTTLRQ